jgi:hypothetical protein
VFLGTRRRATKKVHAKMRIVAFRDPIRTPCPRLMLLYHKCDGGYPDCNHSLRSDQGRFWLKQSRFTWLGAFLIRPPLPSISNSVWERIHHDDCDQKRRSTWTEITAEQQSSGENERYVSWNECDAICCIDVNEQYYAIVCRSGPEPYRYRYSSLDRKGIKHFDLIVYS